MKKVVCILFLAFFQLTALSYAQSLDSLLYSLSFTKQNDQKLDILHKITYKYLFTQPDSALYYAQQAESLAQKLKKLDNQAFTIYQQGVAWRNKGDLVKALGLYQKSIKLAEKISDKSLIARNIATIGSVYYTMGIYTLSANYYHKALTLFEELKQPERMGIVLSNLGNVYISLGKYDSAQYFAEKAIFFIKRYEPEFQPFAYLVLSEVKFRQKQYEMAYDSLQKTLAFAEKYTDKYVLSGTYQLLAEIDYLKANYPSALKYAQNAAQVAEKSRLKVKMYLAYQTFSKILETQGDLKNALKYKNLFILYRDSVQSGLTKDALKVFEEEKEQNAIDLLKAEQQIQLDQQRFFTYLAIIAFMIMLAIASFILHSRQKAKNNNKKLQTAHQEIKDKQEEILVQNEELRLQKEEIATFNSHLESLVEERTKKLSQSNQQLTEYAFFNAHKLRSPVATILGLYELLNLNPSFEEREFIIEKIKVSIENLDQMVKQSQSLLDEVEDE